MSPSDDTVVPTLYNKLVDFAIGGSQENVLQIVTLLRWFVVVFLIVSVFIIFFEHMCGFDRQGDGFALLHQTLDKFTVASKGSV
jgi:Ni,Fe-hydrogenase I cytochrome b subunit